MSVLASLFMAGCSQDGIESNDKMDGNGETVNRYMAVNLVSSDDGDAFTRAKTGFEDGTAAENQITGVRFYFFNAAGSAAAVKALEEDGTYKYVNYYDWTPGEMESDDPNDDIEKRYKAVIVISTKQGDEIPQMMAAVLNPTADLKAKGNQSLEQLRAIGDDYAKTELTQSGKFVMFNSVYSQDKELVDGVHITADNLASSEAEAKEHPVKLYVERGVAKVSVEVGIKEDYNEDSKLLKLKDKDGNPIEVDNSNPDETLEPVYLKLGQWGLTAETDKGRLVKHINPAWDKQWIQSAQSQYNYRSCWAINFMEAKNIYDKYSNAKNGNADLGASNYLYTNENAELNDINNTQGTARERTKVKLNGLLCKKDGTPITLVRHMGSHFVDTYNGEDESKNLVKLKESILSQLNAAEKKYYTAEAGESVKFTQISPEDLKIVIAEQQEKEESNANCYVYATLSDTGKGKTWYSDNTESYNDHKVEDITEIEDALNNKDLVDRALVWREGMTYYYFEILHNKAGNQPGVVRNHVYKTKITSIAGLGTPVYDPEQTIYPEKPEDNDHYIAAEVNILSWHIVSDSYDLKW